MTYICHYGDFSCFLTVYFRNFTITIIETTHYQWLQKCGNAPTFAT
ncbi:hypothetical protein HMPREF9419_1431 [Prevotella nigrescens ATCC 33563]|nr:hypothetical protein HMPREF9419_1431 [Prevotella nigrescens ATCC 33563]